MQILFHEQQMLQDRFLQAPLRYIICLLIWIMLLHSAEGEMQSSDGRSVQLAIVDHVAYVVTGKALLTIDVTSASCPKMLKSLDFKTTITGIALSDGHIFIACNNTLSDYKIKAKQAPVFEHHLAFNGMIHDFTIENNKFHGVIGEQQRYFIMRDLKQGVTLIQCAVDSESGTVAVANNVAFILAHDRGIQTIDLKHPSRQVTASIHKLFYDSMEYGADWLIAKNGYLYILRYDSKVCGFVIHKPPLSECDKSVSGCTFADIAYGATCSNNKLLLLGSVEDLYIVAMMNPLAPRVIGSYCSESLEEPQAAAADGKFAYILYGEEGSNGPTQMRIIDISNAAHPQAMVVYELGKK
jgi:hypothetical protein